jgi:hypothetical protein
LGFGEQLELLAAASDAEALLWASLRGDRLFLPGLGYRVRGGWTRDKPRFFDEEGDEINRGRFERESIEAALVSSFGRWGLAEAGARFGRVETHPEAGLDMTESLDQVGALFGRLVVDTLDDLAWPERGRRLAAHGQWSLASLGAERRYWRLEVEWRIARPLASPDGPVTGGRLGRRPARLRWYRLRGVELLPGYRHEELKAPRPWPGPRPSLPRQGCGCSCAAARTTCSPTSDIRLDGLRWGVGVRA